ncbi:MAG TPA: hypothetical protein VGM87_15815 [Roseomonas sp.]
MPSDFLHRHREFADLIRVVANAMQIASALVEKDYWIMHRLHGLQRLGHSSQHEPALRHRDAGPAAA